ncbi:MAG: ATP synthase F1 subunit epsilon [Oscillospiraceae bacterium]|nr:ATP synthase F1 subunit epsilon [Oscillospiraceae bacterium]
MNTFPLRIVTPDGVRFDGDAEELIVRTTSGDIGIMAGHINYVAPLGMGQATVLAEGNKRYGACIGGMVSVVDGAVTLVATTFEWSEDIDIDRANASKKRGEEVLSDKNASDADIMLAKARIKRALVRSGVAGQRKLY